MAYFERTGEQSFRATEHVGGAWDLRTQHIAPALGLLAHAVLLRAWLMQPRDTDGLRGSTLDRIAPPDDMAALDPTTVWPGGFIASAEVRRRQLEPGRATFWVRTAWGVARLRHPRVVRRRRSRAHRERDPRPARTGRNQQPAADRASLTPCVGLARAISRPGGLR